MSILKVQLPNQTTFTQLETGSLDDFSSLYNILPRFFCKKFFAVRVKKPDKMGLKANRYRLCSCLENNNQ